jgi:transposase
MVEPLLPMPPGSAADHDLRVVINSILFLLRSGTPLRTAPPWSTAEWYYARWQSDGTWDKIIDTLRGARP